MRALHIHYTRVHVIPFNWSAYFLRMASTNAVFCGSPNSRNGPSFRLNPFLQNFIATSTYRKSFSIWWSYGKCNV